MKLILKITERPGWRTFVRYSLFCIVGTTGMAVDMGILWLLADPKALAWNLNLSKLIAAEVAIINNFLWNDLWTFHGLGCATGGWKARLSRFGKFNVICSAGVGLCVLLLDVQGQRWCCGLADRAPEQGLRH